MEKSDSPEKFCLKWNEYETNISSTFKDLRNDQDFVDVTLAGDGDFQIEVHKIVLAASSPFFNSLLKKNRKEDMYPLVYLKGVTERNLRSVVDFIYHGEVNVFQEDLKDFLAVAEDLKLRGLRQDDDVLEEPRDEDDSIKTGCQVTDDPRNNKDIENNQGDESCDQNGPTKMVVEETDDIEQMIDSMMVRVSGEWICGICGKKAGKFKNNLRKHVEIAHVDQQGKPCQFCGKTFKSRPNLYAHMRRCQQSSTNKSQPVQPAYLSFIQQEKPKEDEPDGQLMVADAVEVDLQEEDGLEAKVSSLMTQLDGDWTCGVCGKSFGPLKDNLKQHVLANHVDGLVLPCNACGCTFG